MNNQKRPPVKWLVPLPADDPYGDKAFKDACRGKSDLADMLNYFMYAVSKEVESNPELDVSSGTLTITRFLKTICEHLQISKKTAIARIQQLVEWEFLTSHAYHHRYDVHVVSVGDAIKNPPQVEKPKVRGRHAVKSTLLTLSPLSEREEGKECKECTNLPDERMVDLTQRIVNLQSQMVDLTQRIVSLQSQMVDLQSLQSSEDNAQAAGEPLFDPLTLLTITLTLLNKESNTASTFLGSASAPPISSTSLSETVPEMTTPSPAERDTPMPDIHPVLTTSGETLGSTWLHDNEPEPTVTPDTPFAEMDSAVLAGLEEQESAVYAAFTPAQDEQALQPFPDVFATLKTEKDYDTFFAHLAEFSTGDVENSASGVDSDTESHFGPEDGTPTETRIPTQRPAVRIVQPVFTLPFHMHDGLPNWDYAMVTTFATGKGHADVLEPPCGDLELARRAGSPLSAHQRDVRPDRVAAVEAPRHDNTPHTQATPETAVTPSEPAEQRGVLPAGDEPPVHPRRARKPTVPTTPPVMPGADAVWCAETLLEVFEARQGRRYPNGAKRRSQRIRDNELEACVVLHGMSDLWGDDVLKNVRRLDTIINHIETRNKNWWLNTNGRVLPHQLVDKDRIHTMVDELKRMRTGNGAGTSSGAAPVRVPVAVSSLPSTPTREQLRAEPC